MPDAAIITNRKNPLTRKNTEKEPEPCDGFRLGALQDGLEPTTP